MVLLYFVPNWCTGSSAPCLWPLLLRMLIRRKLFSFVPSCLRLLNMSPIFISEFGELLGHKFHHTWVIRSQSILSPFLALSFSHFLLTQQCSGLLLLCLKFRVHIVAKVIFFSRFFVIGILVFIFVLDRTAASFVLFLVALEQLYVFDKCPIIWYTVWEFLDHFYFASSGALFLIFIWLTYHLEMLHY
jgi:hypothetical protein